MPKSTGTAMHTIRRVRPGLGQRAAPTLSREAKVWLAVMDYLDEPGRTISGTARHFGFHRNSVAKKRKGYRRHDLTSLEPKSRRPKRCRTPKWTMADAAAVRAMRLRYPGWGKDKLAVLLAAEGITLSVSTVGRILSWLKKRGRLREPVRRQIRRSHRTTRPHAVRKPQGYAVTAPGDLVQIDTIHLHPLPGITRFQFSAIDVVSRQAFGLVTTTASAAKASSMLDLIAKQSPVPITAVQVDGGSEFMAEFEQACQQRDIRLFVLPPRSPKLNGCVERFNGTSRREFWEYYDGELDIGSAQHALSAWLRIYNHIRPHQALGYRTPAAALEADHLHTMY